MTRHSYLHLDVFTDTLYEGNQLAVFPDAQGIDERWMQTIAREIGFSETVFMLPPVTETAQRRLRIFTPGRELPLAGHPTIGSAFVWAREFAGSRRPAEITFDLKVGPIVLTLEWARGAAAEGSPDLDFAWMRMPTPTFGAPLDAAAAAAFVRALHLPPATALVAPPQLVSSGTPFLFVPLASEADVDAARPDAARLSEAFAAVGEPETGVLLFARATRPGATFYSRMFAPMFGIQEDPATGSASGPLGAYALATGIVTADEAPALVSLQGARMGRPSVIHIGVTGTRDRVDVVKIGGRSQFVAEGLFGVPAGAPVQ